MTVITTCEACLKEMFLQLGLREVDTIEDHTTGGFFDVPALPSEKEHAAAELAADAAQILLKIQHERT